MEVSKSLADLSIELGLAPRPQIEEVEARALIFGGDFATNALDTNVLGEVALLKTTALLLGLPASSGAHRLHRAPTEKLLESGTLGYARKENRGLVVVVTEPLSESSKEVLEKNFGGPIHVEVALLVRIEEALQGTLDRPVGDQAKNVLARLPAGQFELLEEDDVPPSVGAAAEVSGNAVPRVEAAPEKVAPLVPTEPDVAHFDEQPASVEFGNTAPPPDGYEHYTQSAARDVLPNELERRKTGSAFSREIGRALLAARERDEVLDVLLDAASEFFEFTAIFTVTASEARLHSARGPGAAELRSSQIRIPLDLPSTYKKVIASSVHQLSRLKASGIEGGVVSDLKRPRSLRALLLPIMIRGRTVLLLQGDRGEDEVELAEIGPVLDLAPAAGQALERVLLERKRQSLVPSALSAGEALRSVTKEASVVPAAEGDGASSTNTSSTNTSSKSTARESSPPKVRAADAMAPPERTSIDPEPSPEAPAAEPKTRTPTGRNFAAAPASSFEAVDVASTEGAPNRPVGSAPLAQIALEKRAVEREKVAPKAASSDAENPERGENAVNSGAMPSAPTFPLESAKTKQSKFASTGATSEPHVPTTRGVALAQELEQALAPPPPEAEASAEPSATSDSNEPHAVVENAPRRLHPISEFPAEHTKTLPGFPHPLQALDRLAPTPAPPKIEETDVVPPPPEAFVRPVRQPQTSLVPRRIVPLDSKPGPRRTPSGEVAPPILAAPEFSPPEIRPTGTMVSRRPLMNEPPEDGWESPAAPRVAAAVGPRDYGAQVDALIAGDTRALKGLLDGGESAIASLVAHFPGPVTEPRDSKTRAAECGPVLNALAQFGGKAIPFITVRTADENAFVRRYATLLLGDLPSRESARAVAGRLLDSALEVRKAALASARHLQSDPASRRTIRADLEEIVADRKQSNETRCAAIESLADIREQEAVPILLQLLGESERSIGRAAVWALCVLTRHDFGTNAAKWREFWQEHRDTPRLEWLILALGQNNPDLRRAAADELNAISGLNLRLSDEATESDRRMAQAEVRRWLETRPSLAAKNPRA